MIPSTRLDQTPTERIDPDAPDEDERKAASSRASSAAANGVSLGFVIGAAAAGTLIEWYDFYLYAVLTPFLAPLFFPSSNPATSLLAGFATFGAGFAVRPLGALVFGRIGDLVGRKIAFVLTVSLMGGSTVAAGLLPTYQRVGIAAPVLLVLLRCLQGLALGGEYGGAAVYVAEHAPDSKRGYYTSWIQTTATLGLFLALAVILSTRLTLGDATFKAWAWRIPFLVSLVLVAVGLWIRLKVMETPLFSQLTARQAVAKVPVAEVVRSHWKEIIYSAFLRMSEQASFYLYTTFALTYIKTHLGLAQSLALGAVSVAAAFELFLIPTFGHLSDRLGRRRVYVSGAVLIAIVAFPSFALLNTKTAGLVIIAIVLMAIAHSIQYGPQAAYIAESFPTRLGYAGSGMGYQLASLIAGGPAPLLATWMLPNFGWQAICVYIIACAVITLVAAWLLPDRSKADLAAATPVGAAAEVS